MGIPDFPRGAPEGTDNTGGNCVDPGEAARETREISDAMTAAEDFTASQQLGGYAGGEMPPGLNALIVQTGSDDVPAS